MVAAKPKPLPLFSSIFMQFESVQISSFGGKWVVVTYFALEIIIDREKPQKNLKSWTY